MRFARILFLAALLALIVVPAAFAIRFTDDSYNMPTGYVGQAYSKQFNGAGGCGPALPYQYTLIGGKLPPGLSLSFSGLISGTPTQAGSWSFWVNLSDQNPPSATWCRPATSQRQFTITVVSTGSVPAVKIVQSSLNPTATVLNAPYRFQLNAQGGGTRTWSVQSGTLPTGITLSSGGLLSGTPSATGDFSFTVRVSDGMTSDARTYTLTIVAPLKITPLTASPVGEVAVPFQLQPAATGGKPGFTWSLAGGTTLPAGLTLDPHTGAIGGRPALAGSFPLKLTVTDALGLTDTLDVELAVAPELATAKKALTTKVGHALVARLRAAGGVLPRSWKIVRGSLPAGIRLNPETGTLTGRARRVGISIVIVQATDELGAVSRARLVLKVIH